MSSLVLGPEFSPYYRDINEGRPYFDDKAYDALNEKFNIEEYTTREKFLNHVFSQEHVNEFCNYLLSLNDEKYRVFVWKYLYALDDCELVGDLKELYDKFKIDEDYYFKHNDHFIERNKTRSIKNEVVKVKPLTEKSACFLLDNIDKNEDNGGFDSYIHNVVFNNYIFYNEENLCFEVKNERNQIVGAIGITPEHKGLGLYENTYALFYYITPKQRNKGYVKNAIKLMLELIKEKKIYREELDPLYERRYVKNKIDINLLNIYIKSDNIYSIKAMESLGVCKTGAFKTYENGTFIDWNQYQITFD